MEPIRLLIADDHRMVRDGLRRLLERESDLTVVGETGRVQETLDAAERLQPDVLLLDLRLADGNGRVVLAALPKQPRPIRVIAMTGHQQEDGSLPRFGRGAGYPREAGVNGGVAEELIGLGASGYLLKTASAQELIQAIRAVHDGEIWADHGTLSRLVAHLRTGSEDAKRRDGRLRKRRDGETERRRDGEGVPVSSFPRFPVSPSRRGVAGPLSARELEILQEVGNGYNNSEIAQRLYISENTVKAHLSRIFQKLLVTDRTQAVVIGLQSGLITPLDMQQRGN